MNIAQPLLVKYGLTHLPSNTDVAQWLYEVETLVELGADREEAGQNAAKRIFQEVGSCVYLSQAETIETLLLMAKKK